MMWFFSLCTMTVITSTESAMMLTQTNLEGLTVLGEDDTLSFTHLVNASILNGNLPISQPRQMSNLLGSSK